MTDIPADLTFSPSDLRVTFPMNSNTSMTMCVNVTGISDDIAEGDEAMAVIIVESPSNFTINARDEFTETVLITVIDDDSKYVVATLF